MTKHALRRPLKASAKDAASLPPPPFKAAPAHLSPLLSVLSKESVYITHIDRHPAGFKQRIFIVPVLLNFAILMGLIWRLYAVLPWYWSLAVIFSQGTAALETTMSMRLAFVILRRLLSFIIDYLLITFIWKWPISFFVEQPESPVSWRWKVWFRDSEIVVRISRNWGKEDLMGGVKQGGESPFFKTRILPALGLDRMQKTGYLLQDGDWDLDFALMVYATRLADKGDIKETSLDRKVIAWMGDEKDGQWVVWDEKTYGQEIEEEEVEELEQVTNTEGREKILLIQDKLVAMGKEDLFYKWVELIQYESTRPGGFTRERQLEAGLKVQSLFEEHGVDFEAFEKAVGGMQR